MKIASAFCIALCLAVTPAVAQEESSDLEEGFSLFEEGAKLIMRGMMEEMKPALNQLQDDLGLALTEMEPALRELARMIGDVKNYHAPEMLPNGDIIIRRKAPLPPVSPDGEIEL